MYAKFNKRYIIRVFYNLLRIIKTDKDAASLSLFTIAFLLWIRGLVVIFLISSSQDF